MRFSSIVAAALLAFTMGTTAAPLYEFHEIEARTEAKAPGGGTWVKVGDVYVLSNNQNQIVGAVTSVGGNAQSSNAQANNGGTAYSGDQTAESKNIIKPAKPEKPKGRQ